MSEATTLERPEGVDEAVWNQAVAMAEAIQPQQDAAIERRVQAAEERMRQEVALAMGIAASRSGAKTPTRPPLPGARGAVSGPTPFASWEDYMGAVVSSSRERAAVHEGLREIGAASGMSEGVGADGGFFLQVDMATDVLREIQETGLVWGLIPDSKKFPAPPQGNARKMPAVDETSRANGSRNGGVLAYWTAEAAALTATKTKFKTIGLELDKITALSYFTNEEMEDIPYVAAFVRSLHPEEMAFKIDDALVNGTGAGTVMGFLNSSALITVDAQPGQPAATVLYENARDMWARMPAKNRRNAYWLINQEIEPQLMGMYLAIGTGGIPVYMPAGGISGLPYATLFGRPVMPIEQASALGTKGDISLADMNAYWALLKGGAKQALSEHVQFTTDEVALRTTFRVDARPQWTSALTPFKGSKTISPFITLAARP